MENILQKVSDTITDKSVKVTVDIKPTSSWHALLMKWKIKPSKRVFVVTGIVWGNLIRISAITSGMKETLNDLLTDVQDKIVTYGPDIVDIVAIGLHNKMSEPPESLKQFILKNMTAAEITDVMAVILRQMDVSGFIKAIISIKGINVLDQMSREQMGSLIAPGEQLAAS